MHPQIRTIMVALFCLVCLGMTACSFPPRIYRIDVRQGNFITPEMIAKLKVGMNKTEVQELMGTPALTHFFEKNRWDYYYYLKPGNGAPISEKRISVFFKGDQVVRLFEEVR